MRHTCHWPGCEVEVPPALWGCRPHWYSLPRHLRALIWKTYRRGQEVRKDPSPEYVEAARAVQRWIAAYRVSRPQYPPRKQITQEGQPPVVNPSMELSGLTAPHGAALAGDSEGVPSAGRRTGNEGAPR